MSGCRPSYDEAALQEAGQSSSLPTYTTRSRSLAHSFALQRAEAGLTKRRERRVCAPRSRWRPFLARLARSPAGRRGTFGYPIRD
jgi:hypothetical protein